MLKCGALCALLAMGKGDQMEWFEAVDGYCKRVDATFFARTHQIGDECRVFDCGDLGVAVS